MAFGQELQDFVAGFTTGYKLIDSKEEKEWKREERRMKKEGFERENRWGDEDRSYRRDRDNIEDGRWDKSFEYRRDRDNTEDGRWDKSFEYRQGRDARSDSNWDYEAAEREKARLIAEDRQKRILREKTGGAITDEVESAPVYGIPDDTRGADPEKTSSVTTGGNEWLKYANANATRNQPLSPKLETALAKIAPQMGIEVEVFSGGQPAKGRRRTGSRRHDHGDAADVFFYKDGRKLDWANPQDRPVFEKIVQLGKAEGLTGFGAGDGYMRSGSMHVGFGSPAVWGKGGSSEKAAPWLAKAYAGNYARGGAVEAIPIDEEEKEDTSLFTIAVDDAPEEVEVAQTSTETALPDDGPIPPARYEGEGVQDGSKAAVDDAPTDDAYETAYRAAREGLNRALAGAKADAQTAIDDPEMNKHLDRFARGYGAAPQQVVRQMMDKIDPEKKMPDGQRNMLAMANTYRFFWDRGEPEKAKEAAASLVQYYNKSYQQFQALAQAAAENGDVDNAAKAAMAAYANIPNGRDLSITKNEDGSLTAMVTDGKTGKEVASKILKPEEMLATAMGFTPQTFYDELMNAAGAPAEKYDDASLEDIGKVADSIRATIETDFAESGLTKEGLAGVEDVATGIAKVKQNGLSPSQAVRLAAGMLSAPSMDDIYVKKERGHPDKVKVGFGGQEFVMPTGQFNLIKQAHKERGAKADAEKKKSEESAKWWSDQGDILKQGVKAFTDEGGAVSAGRAVGYMVAPSAIPEDTSEEERDRAMDDYLNP